MLYLRNMRNVKYSSNVHSSVQTGENKNKSQDMEFKKNILKCSIPEKTIFPTNHTRGNVIGLSTEIIKPPLPWPVGISH